MVRRGRFGVVCLLSRYLLGREGICVLELGGLDGREIEVLREEGREGREDAERYERVVQ